MNHTETYTGTLATTVGTYGEVYITANAEPPFPWDWDWQSRRKLIEIIEASERLAAKRRLTLEQQNPAA